MAMKRQKAANILRLPILLCKVPTVKIYFWGLNRPSTHNLSWPTAGKTKRILLASGSLEHRIPAEDKKNSSAQEKRIPGSRGRCSWNAHVSCLKTKQNQYNPVKPHSTQCGDSINCSIPRAELPKGPLEPSPVVQQSALGQD